MPDYPSLLQRLKSKYSESIEFVWANQADWPVRHCSSEIQHILGYTQEEMTSGKIKYAELIHPDDLPTVLEEVRSATRHPNTHEFTHKDYRLRTKQGEWIWVEDHTLIDRSEDGQVQHYIGLLHVVTRRHEIEDELQRNRERLELVLQSTRLGMWDWNPQTNEVHFDRNWARQLGIPYKALQLNLEDWKSRVHPDDMQQCFADIQAHIDGYTDFYQNIHRIRHMDGHWVYILDRGRIVERDSKGRPTRFTGTHFDLTALKEAELKAKAALKSRDRFFSSVSHELRTPLHGILGIADWLLQENEDPEMQKRLQVIRNSGDYLLRVVSDILDISKFDEGKLRQNPSPTQLYPLIDHVHHLFQERSLEKHLEFIIERPDNQDPYLFVDEHRLMQLFSNLVSNAVKYTNEGSVGIRVQIHDDQSIRIEIVDTGIGIKDTEKVFQPFEQEDLNSQPQITGSGLGLSICQRLCELLDIRLSLNSVVNQGSTFSLHIPAKLRCNPPDTPKFQAQSAPQQSTTSMHCSLLIADDSDSNRLVTSSMLIGTDIVVHQAADGLAALDVCRQEKPDVILMDLHMPGMDGLAATRIIRNEMPDYHPVILAMTADAYPDTMEQCYNAGMNGSLTKPFNREELLKAILEEHTQEGAKA